jgi:multiple sugar transport system permease protein
MLGHSRASLGRWVRQDTFLFILVGPPFLVLFLLTVGPLLLAIGIGLLNWNLARAGGPEFIGLENFVHMFGDRKFWNSAFLTGYQVSVTVLGQVVLGMGIALLLARTFPGAHLARSLYLVPMMTTPIVVGLTWRMLFNDEIGMINYLLGLVNIEGPNWLGDPRFAMPAVIVTDWWLSTPFVTIILLAGLQSLPREPVEAAQIDGASAWGTFRFITLPLLMPIVWLAVLFRTMDAIRRFDTIFVMTAGGPGNATETLNLHAYFHAFQFLNVGYSSALSTLLFVIIASTSLLLLQRVRRNTL